MEQHNVNQALAAVDAMHVALIALNSADGVFAVEFAGTPYAALKDTLKRTLALVGTEALDLAPDEAQDDAGRIYDYMVGTGESVDAAFRHVGGVWAGQGIYGVNAGARLAGNR